MVETRARIAAAIADEMERISDAKLQGAVAVLVAEQSNKLDNCGVDYYSGIQFPEALLLLSITKLSHVPVWRRNQS